MSALAGAQETLLLPSRRPPGPSALRMYLPVVTVTLSDILPVAITVAVQRLSDMRVGPDTAHLFIDVLTEVGYIEDRTPIIEARIIEVFSQTFERGERNFPFVDVHK